MSSGFLHLSTPLLCFPKAPLCLTEEAQDIWAHWSNIWSLEPYCNINGDLRFRQLLDKHADQGQRDLSFV